MILHVLADRQSEYLSGLSPYALHPSPVCLGPIRLYVCLSRRRVVLLVKGAPQAKEGSGGTQGWPWAGKRVASMSYVSASSLFTVC